MGWGPTEAAIDELEEPLDSLAAKADAEGEQISADIERVRNRIREISKSWSGSWLGHHASLYYNDFQRPPSEHRFDPDWGTMRGLRGHWLEVDFEMVQKVVEEGAPRSLDDLHSAASSLVEEAKQLREQVLMALAPIRGVDGFEAGTELLEELESHSWGFSIDKFARHQMPKNFVTRDQRAMSEGPQVPPHIAYDCNLMAIQSKIESVKDFCTKAQRLSGQTKNKFAVAAVSAEGNGDVDDAGEGLILQICRGFHRAARQIRERHGGRPTLNVNDEYDVQDLLHAILRLHFADIRKEEYTPSYAGGSSRMDFLLKNERIVIEVKKTRPGLGTKKVGEELMIDIGRYNAHPDCETLVCFVYDPEGRVANPRGVEADLNGLSTESLQVVALIEPS